MTVLGETDRQWRSIALRFRPRLILVVSCLMRRVLGRSENPGYAEDIAAEALAAAYEKRRGYDPSRGQLYPWLVQIARNRARDFVRRHRHLGRERPLDDCPECAAAPDGCAFAGDGEPPASPRDLAVRRALGRLRHHDRELLVRRLGTGLDYGELERSFGFTVKKNTLRVQVKRARARLRRELTKERALREILDRGARAIHGHS